VEDPPTKRSQEDSNVPVGSRGFRAIVRGIYKGEFGERVRFIAKHTVVLGFILCSIWVIQWLLNNLLGKEAKFFDLIPIRYTTHCADVIVLGEYLWSLVNTLRRKK